MLICSVCRSQNMDTAKFCGNCGNPFTSQNESTSSLINCSQGHIYSAVYQYCPYCPQPESLDQADFATRIEDAVSPMPGSGQGFSDQINSDFATRIDSGDTVFETVETPVIKHDERPTLPPTEVITSNPAYDDLVQSATASNKPTEVEPPIDHVKGGNHENIILEDESEVELFHEPAIPPPPPPPQSRHTMIASAPEVPGQSAKGKIVGWLITYSNNPDGRDYHIYAGYNRMGANPVCDIIIDDETVSGSHAILVFRDGRCLIKDDLSRNGTFVNGREITEAHPLQNYDQIRVGNTNLTYVTAEKPN